MAAKVLLGQFGPKRPSLESEIHETLRVTSALMAAEAYLENRPARRHDPTTYFLRSLLCATRWEIEGAFIAKACREGRGKLLRAWASP